MTRCGHPPCFRTSSWRSSFPGWAFWILFSASTYRYDYDLLSSSFIPLGIGPMYKTSSPALRYWPQCKVCMYCSMYVLSTSFSSYNHADFVIPFPRATEMYLHRLLPSPLLRIYIILVIVSLGHMLSDEVFWHETRSYSGMRLVWFIAV